jgi:Flp pilus assembly protein TadG
MRIDPTGKRKRRGVMIIFTAIMLVVLLGCVAFAIDLGYIIAARAQMQNAADAAALAGASQLLSPSLLEGNPTQSTAITTTMANVRTQARAYSLLNPCFKSALALGDNTSNSASGDIVCGYMANPYDRTQAFTPTVAADGPAPNVVQVNIHHDSIRNGSLSLFFARILGSSSANLQATAMAGYQAQITGFKISAPGYSTCKLLPFTLDVNVWNDVLAGNGPDAFTRNTTTGAVTSGADGIPECKLYPLSNGNGNGKGSGGLPPGNFGTVDLGAPNNSTSDLARQILYGPNASDLSYFADDTIQLDPGTQTLILQGDTGISAGVKDELASIIGQPRIIPLYSSVSGPGNNARYTIVAFAGIVITDVVLTGSLSSKHITIQPCFVIDPNAIGGGESSSTSYYVVKPLGLLR